MHCVRVTAAGDVQPRTVQRARTVLGPMSLRRMAATVAVSSAAAAAFGAAAPAAPGAAAGDSVATRVLTTLYREPRGRARASWRRLNHGRPARSESGLHAAVSASCRTASLVCSTASCAASGVRVRGLGLLARPLQIYWSQLSLRGRLALSRRACTSGSYLHACEWESKHNKGGTP